MIEGTVVNLRAPDLADLERNHRWINDRDVTKYLGGTARYAMSMAAEEAWMRTLCSQQMSYERVFFAIETKDGRHIGNTNLFNSSPEVRLAELGIMIGDKEYWNRGYGTDAMLTLVRFGFEQMNLHRIALGVFAFNDRAQAVYRKVGFVEEGRERDAYYQDGRYWDVLRMSILREEWDAAQGSRIEVEATAP